MANGESEVKSVSIVITSYNRERWIQAAVESALTQTRPAGEVLVVDDGSTDGTQKVLSCYNQKIRLISIENDGTGQTRPLNIGIEAASSKLVFLLDSDDRIHAEALDLHLKAYERCPGVGLVSSNWVDEYHNEESGIESRHNEAVWVRNHKHDVLADDMLLIKREVAYEMLCKGNFLRSCTGNSFPKKVWKKVGGFDESIRTSTDYNFLFRVLREYDMIYIDKPLRSLSRHSENVSNAVIKIKFRPEIYLDCLRIIERELSAPQSANCKTLLAQNKHSWLLELAYNYRKARRYRECIETYLKCIVHPGFRMAALKGLAVAPLECVAGWKRRLLGK